MEKSNFDPYWQERFLDLAEYYASWSKDPSTKCGAVLVDDKKRVISIGFNGFPSRIEDDPDLLNNREKKYKLVIHAEMNAILYCPQSTEGLHIFVSGPTCDNCAKHIVAADIASVTWYEPNPEQWERWKESITVAMETYCLANVPVFVIPRKKVV